MTYLIQDLIDGKTVRKAYIDAASREEAQERYIDHCEAQGFVSGQLLINKVSA